MKITNLHLDPHESAHILALARKSLKRQHLPLDLLTQLTPQNLLRLALHLPLKHRGGPRPNTGPKPKRPSN